MSSPTTSGKRRRQALVVGCGTAGPVLAMFLQKAGWDPVVYEGRPKPDDAAGYFLNLAPNGVAVLDSLGIKEEVVGRGSPTTSLVLRNHRAKTLGTVPQNSVLIKRGELNGALREAALGAAVPIEFGKRLSDVEVVPGGVVARFEDGSEAEGDGLVGCDGIWSKTRRRVMPEAPAPRYTGLIDSGGFTRTAGVRPSDGVFSMTFGAAAFFGYQVLPSGDVYWFENFHRLSEPGRGELEVIPGDAWRQKLLEQHRHDHPPIADIIGSTEGRIGRWPNYEVPSLPTWHRGPVCLLGDAAHAMQPSAGQGASMALEDSVVLARCLRDVPRMEDAFAAYERLRRGRAEKFAEAARRNGARKRPTNAVSRGIRDLVMPVFLKLAARSASRGHDHRVEWEEKVPA